MIRLRAEDAAVERLRLRKPARAMMREPGGEIALERGTRRNGVGSRFI
jgi:hypothetical protein